MPPSPVEDATDASTTTCTFTGDELDLPSSLFSEDPAAIGCSRPIWDGTDSDRCVWHAEGTDKPPDDLAATVADSTLLGARARETDLHRVPFPEEPDLRKADLSEADLVEADLSGADLRKADLSGADLQYADLSGASLFSADLSEAELGLADLSGADLREADLSEVALFSADLPGADLRKADLPGADLRKADLSEAELGLADLSGADLRKADLSEASLVEADLSGTDLRKADLSGADLTHATLADLTLNQGTRITWIRTAPRSWDALAQVYHDLKTECSDHGLNEKARTVRAFELRARTQEARANGDVLTILGGLLSRWLTGYGVRVSYVLGWTGLLLGLTTLWYAFAPTGTWEGGALYYSVVTLVTSPPHPPETTGVIGIATEAIVLFETYVGTTLIILLGYVLGNRDQL